MYNFAQCALEPHINSKQLVQSVAFRHVHDDPCALHDFPQTHLTSTQDPWVHIHYFAWAIVAYAAAATTIHRIAAAAPILYSAARKLKKGPYPLFQPRFRPHPKWWAVAAKLSNEHFP